MNRFPKPILAVRLTLPFSEQDCEKLLMHYSATPSVAADNFEDALTRLLETLAPPLHEFLEINMGMTGTRDYVMLITANEERLADDDHYFGTADALLKHTSELLGIMASHLGTPWKMVLSLPDQSEEFAEAER